jgi:hypothetical protein
MNRNEVLKTILTKKADIADSSARVYTTNLMNVLKHFGWESLKYFNSKYKEVLAYLATLVPQKAKGILSSVLAVASTKKAIEAYQKVMGEMANKVKEVEQKQEKTDKQEESWCSWDDVMKRYHEVEEDALPLFKKTSWTPAQMKAMQHYVVLSCYCLIPPRRIADYTGFKVKDIDTKEDNYYDEDKKQLVFNQYKTAKTYGMQMVDCPLALQKVFDLWYPVASKYSEYLLFNSYGDAMTQPQLTKMINSIFDKKISASMLRHIYISDEVLKDVPKMEDLQKIASDMGHSTGQQMLYKLHSKD